MSWVARSRERSGALWPGPALQLHLAQYSIQAPAAYQAQGTAQGGHSIKDLCEGCKEGRGTCTST